MNKNDETTPVELSPLSKVVSCVQAPASDILILHYKNHLGIRSLAEIFSMEESEVGGIIANFARQFSNIDNLNNVVDCLIKMKKHTSKPDTAAGEEALSSKDREIADLKRRLRESEIKAEAYLEMIKVAERTFRIPIRKKYGAK